MSPKSVLYEKAGAIAMLTINQIQAKAVGAPGLGQDCLQALDKCAQDAQVRLLLFTDLGDQFFTGFQAPEIAEENTEDVVAEIADQICQLPQPVLAGVGGSASGAGFELLLACDLVLASTEATFQPTEPSTRRRTGQTGITRLINLVGTRQATALLLFNPRLSAQEAWGMGLVNRVVAEDVLIEETWNWAEKLVRAPQGYLQEIKAHLP
jgi:enoyl-CoA hydratase/carnithine racemase